MIPLTRSATGLTHVGLLAIGVGLLATVPPGPATAAVRPVADQGSTPRATPTISEFTVPSPRSVPFHITTGADGNLWFTERDANKIGRMTPSGVFSEFQIPTPNSAPTGITLGPDDDVWFTKSTGNRIGRIDTNGVITEYVICGMGAAPARTAHGPDGAIWFTSQGANAIGRITRWAPTASSWSPPRPPGY